MKTMRRSKTSRLRGTHTHGYGSKKKHRGAGSRGGRGMAGTGKRGDVKKPVIWKDKKYFGKHGFKKKNISIKINAITITAVEQMMDILIGKKAAEEKAGTFEIDLKKAGYNKLLSTGKATKKMNITVPYASAKSVEKIKAAGGSVKTEEKKLKSSDSQKEVVKKPKAEEKKSESNNAKKSSQKAKPKEE